MVIARSMNRSSLDYRDNGVSISFGLDGYFATEDKKEIAVLKRLNGYNGLWEIVKETEEKPKSNKPTNVVPVKKTEEKQAESNEDVGDVADNDTESNFLKADLGSLTYAELKSYWAYFRNTGEIELAGNANTETMLANLIKLQETKNKG